jgi:pimeloyl-ACP methyl ester carboxylesterase
VVAAPPVFYLIPGLGADERVFQFLRLQGDVHILRWLPPEGSDEALPHYAARLASAVPVAQACWLVGVSFGGVLALEIAQLRPLARVVLVSSFVGPSELPWIGKLPGGHLIIISRAPDISRILNGLADQKTTTPLVS